MDQSKPKEIKPQPLCKKLGNCILDNDYRIWINKTNVYSSKSKGRTDHPILFPCALSRHYCMTDISLLQCTNTIRTLSSQYAKTNVLRTTQNLKICTYEPPRSAGPGSFDWTCNINRHCITLVYTCICYSCNKHLK